MPRGPQRFPKGAEPYLEYLDKEMTIMGILTAFAGGVPSLVLDRTAGASTSSPFSALWEVERPLILCGSLALFLAALYFYRQRSLLAYYYGQLALSTTPAAYRDKDTAEWIEEADLWTTWDYYAVAFAFTSLGFLYYAIAVVLGTTEEAPAAPTLAYLLPFLTVLIGYLIRRAVFARYCDEYEPWRVWWTGLRQRRTTRGASSTR